MEGTKETSVRPAGESDLAAIASFVAGVRGGARTPARRPWGGSATVGHSEGATLALSALLTLRDAGITMPAAAVALSPITDFTLSAESMDANDSKDVMTLNEIRQVASAYLGSADPEALRNHRWPTTARGLPPLLLACGDVEMLRDDAARFANRADVAGTAVKLEPFEGMPHGFPVLPLDTSHALLENIATFSAERLAAELDGSGVDVAVLGFGDIWTSR